MPGSVRRIDGAGRRWWIAQGTESGGRSGVLEVGTAAAEHAALVRHGAASEARQSSASEARQSSAQRELLTADRRSRIG